MDTCCVSRHPSSSTLPYGSKPSPPVPCSSLQEPHAAQTLHAMGQCVHMLPTLASPAGYSPCYTPTRHKLPPKHHLGASPLPKTPFCRAPSPFEPSRDAAHPQQRLSQQGFGSSTLLAAELEHRKLLTFDAPLGARGLAPAVAALPPAHVHPAGRAQRGEGRRGLPPQPRDRAGGMQSAGGEPPRDGHGAGGDGERLTPAAGACCGAAGRHCCCCCCWPGGSAELCAAARSGPAWRRRRRGCGGREGRRG